MCVTRERFAKCVVVVSLKIEMEIKITMTFWEHCQKMVEIPRIMKYQWNFNPSKIAASEAQVTSSYSVGDLQTKAGKQEIHPDFETQNI